MAFADKILECSDCTGEFTFTAGEQEFYAEKGLTNVPKRCPDCRKARKNRFSGGGGGRPRGGGGGGGRREMFDAVCDSCGYPTKVPFRPNGTKPVYCRSCM